MRSTSITHLLEGLACVDSLRRSRARLPHADERRESCFSPFVKGLREEEEKEEEEEEEEEEEVIGVLFSSQNAA